MDIANSDIVDLVGSRSEVVDLRRGSQEIYAPGTLSGMIQLWGAWMSECGVQPGDRIVILAVGSVECICGILAAATLGAIPILCAPTSGTKLLEHIVNEFDPDFAVAAAVGYRKMRSIQEWRACSTSAYRDYSIYRPVERRLRDAWCENPETPCRPGDIVLTSSGSTGSPKLIVQTFANLVWNAREHGFALGYPDRSRFLHHLPLYYSYGLVAGVLASLIFDLDFVLAEENIGFGRLHQLTETYGVDFLLTTPFSLRRFLAENARFPSSLTAIGIGGDHTSPGEISSLRKQFSGDVFLTYGLSEAGPRVFTNKLGSGDNVDSLGQPMSGIDYRIADAAVDGYGELMIRSPSVMRGYLLNQTLVRDVVENGWLRTGDLVRPTADGTSVKFVGRKKLLVTVNGHKIFTGLVRDVLLSHPAVHDAEVTVEGGEATNTGLVATVSLRRATDIHVSEAQIIRYCLEHLSRAEVPKRIYVTDTLGRTSK